MGSQFNRTKLLVAGQMRSGTTFVGNLLNTQEGFFVYSDMLVSLFDHISALDLTDLNAELGDRAKNILFSNLLAEGLIRGINFNSLDRSEIKTWLQLYDASLSVLASMRDTDVIGVKCTKADRAFSQLLRSGHKIIYCVRDPRDVIHSAQNRFAGVNLSAYVNSWKNGIRRILPLQHEKNFHILKYEDLILNPIEQCRALTEFIGKTVTHDIRGKLIHGTQQGYNDNSSFGDVKGLFDKKAAYRWKNGALSPQVLEVSFLLRDEIRLLGYEDLSSNLSPCDRMRLSLHKKVQASTNSLVEGLKPLLKKWIYG